MKISLKRARKCRRNVERRSLRSTAIPIDSLPPEVQVSDGLAQIAQYEEIYRGFDAPRPVFELGTLQWLKANAPAPLDTVLVHGDFRLGNLMVDETGLVAVLDWELAHLGDPREDIAWICVNSWRFGQSHRTGWADFGRAGRFVESLQSEKRTMHKTPEMSTGGKCSAH